MYHATAASATAGSQQRPSPAHHTQQQTFQPFAQTTRASFSATADNRTSRSLAATARAVLPAASARSHSSAGTASAAAAPPSPSHSHPQHRHISPPSSSFSSSLPPSSYLKASFQIGSTHGRVDFGSDERVFHRSDVPLKAQTAKKEVEAFLRSDLLSTDKPWDSSLVSGPYIRGSKHCSWETPTDRFDARYYAALEADQRIREARTRVEQIRRGVDPDFDPKAVQPRWNISTFVEEKSVGSLGSRPKTQEAGGEAATAASPKSIKFLPADRKSLVSQQTQFTRFQRAQKEEQEAQRAQQAALASSWSSWAAASHVDGPPTHPQLDVMVQPDHEQIRAQVQSTYTQEALQEFLGQKEQQAGAGAQERSGSSSGKRSARSFAPPPTVHHSHRTERHQEQESLPYGSKVPPAWYRAEARTKQVSSALAEAPYPRFIHPGRYEFVPNQTAGANFSESKESLSSSPPQPDGYSYWSCCQHPLRDARGCQAIGVDPTKKRIILGRSDDPFSPAAWGWGATKSHTNKGERGKVGGEGEESMVRARSAEARAAVSQSLHSAPAVGGTATAAALHSGMGLSGPGVAIVKRFEHSGRYDRVPATGELLWSCCGASQPDSQGCLARTITKEHRWQLDSA